MIEGGESYHRLTMISKGFNDFDIFECPHLLTFTKGIKRAEGTFSNGGFVERTWVVKLDRSRLLFVTVSKCFRRRASNICVARQLPQRIR